MDAHGNQLVSSAYATEAGSPLASGVHSMTLSFDGKTLRDKGVDGPYVLDDVYIEQLDTGEYLPPIVSSADNVYTTAAYTARQFEGPPLAVAATAESAEDTNGNGLYDRLAISVTFDVLVPGDYRWMGILVDAEGNLIGDAAGEGRLDNQTPATFTFTGGRIANSQRNGPYRLTDVYVTTTGGNATTAYFYDVHTTSAYPYTQFDATPVAFKDFTQAAVDLNGNGLYDLLVISATVAAIDREGEYSWSGHLAAPDGTEVGTVYGASQLYRDKTLAFTFFGPAIRRAGGDGAYTLRNVTITNQSMPMITAMLPLLYTTPVIQANLFDGADFQITSNGANAVDIDENGLYDKLIFTTTVSVPFRAPTDSATCCWHSSLQELKSMGWGRVIGMNRARCRN